MLRTRRLALASVCLGVFALPGAGEAVTVGQLADDLNEACDGRSNSLVQAGSAPGRRSYAMPRSGVITSWAHNSRGISNSKMKLKVFRKVRGGRFRNIGESGLRRFDRNGVVRYRTRIRVRRGDVLGLGLAPNAPSSPASCFDPDGFRGDREFSVAIDIRPGQARKFTAGPFRVRLNVSARLEADRDKDGFGDKSQDGCPGNPRTRQACPSSQGAPAPPAALRWF